MKKTGILYLISIIIGAVIFLKGTNASGHCDTMDGPVITAAREALNKGDVRLVLIWVQPKDEAYVKELFTQTMKLRSINPDVKKLADMHFFENLVRIHRAGEGFPYTGIKETDKVDLPIAAADKALESGSIDAVVKMLDESVNKGVREKFKAMMSQKNYNKSDVQAGRKFVESYVTFMHYVEGIYNTAEGKNEVHGQKVDESGTENHH